jgi:hypothetical protein
MQFDRAVLAVHLPSSSCAPCLMVFSKFKALDPMFHWDIGIIRIRSQPQHQALHLIVGVQGSTLPMN